MRIPKFCGSGRCRNTVEPGAMLCPQCRKIAKQRALEQRRAAYQRWLAAEQQRVAA